MVKKNSILYSHGFIILEIFYYDSFFLLYPNKYDKNISYKLTQVLKVKMFSFQCNLSVFSYSVVRRRDFQGDETRSNTFFFEEGIPLLYFL